MAPRPFALILVVTTLLSAGCGRDDDPAGISTDQPIGAPPAGFTDAAADGAAAGEQVSPVLKRAFVEVDVARKELNSAAQAVVDLATAPKVGGFLVSSVIDTSEGYGFGNVVVKVPGEHFEQVVGDLERIRGEITRQELEGQDLTSDVLRTRAQLQQTRNRTARLLRRLERSEDSATGFRLREQVLAAKEQLRSLQRNEEYRAAQTAYSTIDVSLAGTAPPPPPDQPALERAFATATTITLAIASAVLIAAGVIVPIALLLVVLYLAGAPLVRWLRPRWGG